jgi:hypothetical protein
MQSIDRAVKAHRRPRQSSAVLSSHSAKADQTAIDGGLILIKCNSSAVEIAPRRDELAFFGGMAHRAGLAKTTRSATSL